MNSALKQQILQLIQAGVLTPEEGFDKLEALRRDEIANRLDQGGTAPHTLVNPAAEDHLLYVKPVWTETGASSAAGQSWPSGCYVLFEGSMQEPTLPVVNSLKQSGIEPIVVRYGSTYRTGESGELWLDASSEADYARLADYLTVHAGGHSERMPLHIIHYAALAADAANVPAGWDERMLTGICSLFGITKALMNNNAFGETRLTYVYSTAVEGPAAHHEAVGSFARVVRNERPNYAFRALGVDLKPGEWGPVVINRMLGMLRTEANERSFEPDIRWHNGVRRVRRLAEAQPVQIGEATPPWTTGGVYLLTGGLGGLGQAFAHMLAGQYRAKLVLCGRREPDADIAAAVSRLEAMGAEVVYIQSDLSSRSAVTGLLDQVRRRFGKLSGVLHFAGIVKDRYLKDKSKSEFDSVLQAKVRSTVLLDEALKDEPLDLFCLYSSISAELGSPGQSDYAYGNSFMDSYAEYREQLRMKRMRSGRTLSVNWPLWRDGGMKVDEETGKLVSRRLGVTLLESNDGFRALMRGLSGSEPHFMVLSGDRNKMRSALGIDQQQGSSSDDANIGRTAAGAQASPPAPRKPKSDADIVDGLKQNLVASTAEFMKIPVHDIGLDTDLGEYGFDSISFMNFSNYLNDRFDFNLMPSIFFEYTTLGALSAHLADLYGEKLRYAEEEVLAASEPTPLFDAAPAVQTDWFVPADAEVRSATVVPTTDMNLELQLDPSDEAEDPVAIIGMSGVMPQSDNLDIFWSKIEAGGNLVTEIPSDRWNWRDYYGDPMTEPNKTNVIWGGFMNGVDKFDPLFFNLSPKEAGFMDPQQRIVLEQVWKTIEDAGYKASQLSGTNTGVYIGVGSMDYGEVLTESGVEANGLSATGLAHCMIANRVSYLLNVHGPSEPVDTACSSSLVAIHKAVESIRSGQCDLALAGGVSVILRPTYYIGLSKAAMLSPDGKCKAFDQGANGYVRGEGCGIVLLKPLSKALADGDHIYALIKGTGTNHGGHANTLTTPNPNAQAELLYDCWSKSGIDPSTVGYMEAHGTGTSLGDPIEVNGLKKAFNRLYEQWHLPSPAAPHCAVGSVKTNVGHLEAAAGMAGIMKVILAMKHGKIPANIHLSELNPYIQMDGSPFYPVRATETWHRMKDAAGRLLPRRAGVSAFGFGGVNGHIIVEEYVDDRQRSEVPQRTKELIVLSAKNRERLAEYAGQLSDYAVRLAQRTPDMSLQQLAYTLQAGREEMEERLAFAAGNVQEMASVLRQFASGSAPADGVFTGRVKSNAGSSKPAAMDSGSVRRRSHEEEIASRWVSGGVIDWRSQWIGGLVPVKVPLPTYPFAKKRCWIPAPPLQAAEGYSVRAHKAAAEARYPSVHTYTVTLAMADPLVDHHRVGGRAVLPGAAQIELALYAARQATGTGWSLSRIVWLEPVVVEREQLELAVTVHSGNGELRAELSGRRDGAAVAYARAEFAPPVPAGSADGVPTATIADIQARSRYLGGQEWCYTPERSGDVAYGPYFQGIEHMWGNEKESIASFRMPESAVQGGAPYELNPVMLDCALQTLKGIQPAERQNGSGAVVIPYALEGLECIQPLPSHAYIHAMVIGPNRFCIEVMDETGSVCVRVREVAMREIKAANRTAASDTEQWLFRPEWQPEASLSAVAPSVAGRGRQRIVLAGAEAVMHFHWDALLKKLNSFADLYVIQSGQSTGRLSSRVWQSDRNDPDGWSVCLREIGPVDHIFFLGGLSIGTTATMTLSTLQQRRERGLIQLFRHVQSLMLHTGGTDDSPLPLTVVTNNVFQVRQGERIDPAGSELVGFTLTLGTESAGLAPCVVDVDAWDNGGCWTAETLADVLKLRLMHTSGSRLMAIRNGVVYTRQMVPANVPPADERERPIRHQGVYMIVGGAGGIGHELALYWARKANARLVLVGRSRLDEEKVRRLRMIEEAGGQAIYVQADASNPAEMKAAVDEAKRCYGPIQGAVHSAVVLRDVTVRRMTVEQLREVLAPKSEGSIVLDEVLAGEPLDFLLFFSSAVSLAGSQGQANYAAGCSFKDAYAAALAEQRSYPVKVINWGYWGTVGVASDEKHNKRLLALGIRSISPEDGMYAVDRVMAGDVNQVMPYKAEPAFLQQMGITQSQERRIVEYTSNLEPEHVRIRPVPTARLDLQAVEYLRGLFAEALALELDELEDNETFETYGVDSVVVLDINRLLERDFGKLPSTLLFEYMTIAKLADYLMSNHEERLQSLFPQQASEPAGQEMMTVNSDYGGTGETEAMAATMETTAPLYSDIGSEEHGRSAGEAEEADADIAIIGVSGIYPKADNIDRYWDNLRQGLDCISEIPADRWRWQDYFDTSEGAHGKSYSKWGGFLSHADTFDPLFFSISPAEAEGMDPQERLFLQTAWAALEDAGITRRELAELNGQVGVFVGAMNGDYEWLGAQATARGILTNAHSNFWSIANRVSYVLDLHGPSLAVDTACSSSLTALHLACESLKRKECKAAIAGGVHLILQPAHYTRYSSVGMLSYGDKVKAFGAGADGFVDGEGVGAVLLKPLDQAVKDGDRIYGIIKATSINSGGKTSGFTVPNLNAQADLVVDALRKSGVDPRTISYVEAHGTGTSLGDPIEIAGLTKAFRTYTPDSHYCAIGTVKSNIGHLESAAGIAALTKVLLQMRHRTIVPSLHSQPPNPKIDFENSPFYVAQQPMVWSRPVIGHHGAEAEYPRRAAISSFGAGGANAHVIVEEYSSSNELLVEERQEGEAIVVLSAKNRERLCDYATRVAAFIQEAESKLAVRLHDVCYTLQAGREPMEERLAFAASSLAEAASMLAHYGDSGEMPPGMYQSSLKGKKKRPTSEGQWNDAAVLHAPAIIREWLSGADIDWKTMYKRLPRRISLPTYPFAEERYWITYDEASLPIGTSASAALHPILDRNESTRQTQRFVKTWQGDEPYLRDHQAGQHTIMPAAAFLAMAWAAGNRSDDRLETVRLASLCWHQPLIVQGEPVQTEIRLIDSPGGVSFEVAPEGANGNVYATGMIEFGTGSETMPNKTKHDLYAVRQRCGSSMPGAEFYGRLEQAGMKYGPTLQVIQTVSFSDLEVIAELNAPPDGLRWAGSARTVHPAVMDGALQAAAAAAFSTAAGQEEPYLPFSADSLEVYEDGAVVHYVYVKALQPLAYVEEQQTVKRYDIALLDAEGNEAAVLRGLTMRRASSISQPAYSNDESGQFLEEWLKQLQTGELTAELVEQLVGGWING